MERDGCRFVFVLLRSFSVRASLSLGPFCILDAAVAHLDTSWIR